MEIYNLKNLNNNLIYWREVHIVDTPNGCIMCLVKFSNKQTSVIYGTSLN